VHPLIYYGAKIIIFGSLRGLSNTMSMAMAHCHGKRLGIRGSWVQIQTLQATLDSGLPQKYKKKISSQEKASS